MVTGKYYIYICISEKKSIGIYMLMPTHSTNTWPLEDQPGTTSLDFSCGGLGAANRRTPQ